MVGFTAILLVIAKAIYKIVKFALNILAHIFVYFGLWIPGIYLLICSILILTGGLDPKVINTNSIIFYIGLAITMLGSLIITVRHLIIQPIHQVLESERAKRELWERKEKEKRQKLYEKNPIKYFKKYEGGMPHKSHPYYDPLSHQKFIAQKIIKQLSFTSMKLISKFFRNTLMVTFK